MLAQINRVNVKVDEELSSGTDGRVNVTLVKMLFHRNVVMMPEQKNRECYDVTVINANTAANQLNSSQVT